MSTKAKLYSDNSITFDKEREIMIF